MGELYYRSVVSSRIFAIIKSSCRVVLVVKCAFVANSLGVSS